MCKAGYSFITFLFFVLVPFLSLAQRGDPDFEMETEEIEEDIEKKEIAPGVSLWELKGYGAFLDSTQLDTLQDYFHVFHPVYKDIITATYLGNYGNPALDNNYFNRNYYTSYYFMQSREAYLFSPSELTYYNSKTPYTRLDFSQSENKSKNNETRFDVIHSQNISPYWNFTFRTNQEKSDGQYTSQESKNKMVALYTSYNKDNWNVYGGFLSSSVENQENGGLVADSLVFENRDPEYWGVNLSDSESKFKNTSYWLNGEYRLGKYSDKEDGTQDFRPLAGILYSFQYDRNKQEFYEEEEDDSFWDNTYYGEDYTKDSIRFNRLSNVVQLKQYENPNKKFTFGKRAYLGYELNKGSMPGTQLNDSVHIRNDISYSNLFIGGGIFREAGKFWTWNFDGKFYLAGRNVGQVQMYGDISKPFTFLNDTTSTITFSGAIENMVPDYFEDNFRSNHFQWTNSLDMEQRIMLGANYKMKEKRFEVGVNYAIVNNLIYNDTLGIPNQTGNEISILSAYLDKDFVLQRFHFRTRVLWQKASNENYIHLPELSAFVSTYYQFTISKVMFTQIGIDGRWNTKYYADAYAPSTGLFYLQNETQYGNYPYIDVYASLRLKRTRVFFKWVNVSTNFIDGVYMTTPHYPMNRATFRLGVSWAFYD